MSFEVRDLRPGMDVFSSDGVFLGSVIHVRRRPAPQETTQRTPPTVSPPDEAAGPPFSGESLGPMPTERLGNGGPAHQQLPTNYATRSDARADSQPTELLVFRSLVALNWRTLWPRLRRYPVSLVLHVSHERIVLAATSAELHGR